MTKQQRFKYEMFVRVRDYGTAHTDLFPASSTGGQTFAQVTEAVSAIDDHLKNRVVATAEARKVKAATRAAVFDYMKTLALTARRVTRSEPGPNPFRIPRRRSLKVEISTARAFSEEAAKREEQFIRFGLPRTFVSDFRARVDELQQAVDTRLSSKTTRRQAKAGIQSMLAQGLEAIRDLDAIVAIGAHQDPVAFGAWQSARHIEGHGSTPAKKVQASAPVIDLPTPTVAASAPVAEQEVADPGSALRKAS
jgi:hypothetical protein